MPEGATSVADLSMDAPAINDQYVAPGGASADRFDGIITIGDKNYVLPVPFTELEKDGWTLDTSVSDYIGGKNYESTYMEKTARSSASSWRTSPAMPFCQSMDISLKSE